MGLLSLFKRNSKTLSNTGLSIDSWRTFCPGQTVVVKTGKFFNRCGVITKIIDYDPEGTSNAEPELMIDIYVKFPNDVDSYIVDINFLENI